MDERRSHTRKSACRVFKISDRNTGRPLGTLVNLSVGGLLLVSNQPIGANRVLQLRLELPADIEGGNPIEMGCESLWADDGEDQHHWTGFQIIDISPENLARIRTLIEEYL